MRHADEQFVDDAAWEQSLRHAAQNAASLSHFCGKPVPERIQKVLDAPPGALVRSRRPPKPRAKHRRSLVRRADGGPPAAE